MAYLVEYWYYTAVTADKADDIIFILMVFISLFDVQIFDKMVLWLVFERRL